MNEKKESVMDSTFMYMEKKKGRYLQIQLVN